MIKKSIYQEGIATINFYAYNNKVSKLMKQKLIKMQGENT